MKTRTVDGVQYVAQADARVLAATLTQESVARFGNDVDHPDYRQFYWFDDTLYAVEDGVHYAVSQVRVAGEPFYAIRTHDLATA